MNVYHRSQQHQRYLVHRYQQHRRKLILVTDFQWSPVTTTSVIRVCGVSMDASFHDGLNETIGGCVRLWRPEISPFGFEVVFRPQGPLIRVCGVLRLLMHLFMVVTMTPSVVASDPGGRRHCCLIVSTVKNLSVVSLTPAIKFSPLSYRRCRWHQRKIYVSFMCRWHRR